jgi:hypothetical protein
MIDRLLDDVEAVVKMAEVEKRNRPYYPADEMASAYTAPINDVDADDDDDDGDADEAAGYDGEDWDADDDATDDDDDGDLEDGVEHPRRVSKVYGRTYSATSGTNSPPPLTHKFETKVREIQHRDGVGPMEAARRARREHPVLHRNYAQSGLMGNADRQALLSAEINKGFSPVVAAQRVMHLHGSVGAPDLMKGDTSAVRFMRCVTKIMKRTGLQRTEAMQQARLRNPRLFARFQNV